LQCHSRERQRHEIQIFKINVTWTSRLGQASKKMGENRGKQHDNEVS